MKFVSLLVLASAVSVLAAPTPVAGDCNGVGQCNGVGNNGSSKSGFGEGLFGSPEPETKSSDKSSSDPLNTDIFGTTSEGAGFGQGGKGEKSSFEFGNNSNGVGKCNGVGQCD